MVLVIDWTATCAPPPIGTSPTLICRLVTGRSCTAASVITLPSFSNYLILFRDKRLSREDFTKIGVGCEQEQHQDKRYPKSRDPAHRLLTHRTTEDLLRGDKEQVPAVERQERQQVEQGEVQADQGQKLREEPLLHAGAPDRRYTHRPRDVVVEAPFACDEVADEVAEETRNPHHLPDRHTHGLERPVRSRLYLGPDADEGGIPVVGVGAELPGEGPLLPIPHDGDADLLSRTALLDLAFEAVPALYPGAVHGDEPVARLDADALGHRVGLDLAHLRLHARDHAGGHENDGEYGHGRQDVCQRPGEDDERPSPGCLGREGIRP